jgi:hypothetical protein
MIGAWAGVGSAARALAAALPWSPAMAFLLVLASFCFVLLLWAIRWEGRSDRGSKVARGWSQMFLALLFVFVGAIGTTIVFSEVVKGTDPGPGMLQEGPCNWSAKETMPFTTPALDLYENVSNRPQAV